MRTRIMIAVAAMLLGSFGVAHADETIGSRSTGPIGAFGVPIAQSFRPDTSGALVGVTLWPLTEPSGEAGELVVFAGDRPGDELGRVEFTWDASPTVVRLDTPVRVAAGATYTLAASGVRVQVVFGLTDPYEGGEMLLQSSSGWQTWTEWNTRCGGCMPYQLDQRFAIEIADNDVDGDGVDDELDACPATVLPDTSVDFLGTRRYAATADGFVDRHGSIVATLADTRGCSARQIVDVLHLGRGHEMFGLTGAHLERWISEQTG